MGRPYSLKTLFSQNCKSVPKKMALENISNVPEVCSESLLEHFIFKIFLGEAPQTPLRNFHWDACGVSVALSPGPPLGKNPGSAPVYCCFPFCIHHYFMCETPSYLCPNTLLHILLKNTFLPVGGGGVMGGPKIPHPKICYPSNPRSLIFLPLKS